MGRRKRYSAEFKREALRRANEPGVSDMLVAEELGINALACSCHDGDFVIRHVLVPLLYFSENAHVHGRRSHPHSKNLRIAWRRRGFP